MDDTGPEGSADEAIAVARRSPDEVFTVLASDTRIEILDALSDPPGEPRSFSALFARASIEDSGNFSYHLDQLVGPFVRKRDDGYVLTHAGEQVVGSILAGTYRADATVEPTPFGGTCLLCGGDLLFEYAAEHAEVRCEDCGQGRRLPFPPGCLSEYTPDELPAVTARWYRTRVQRVTDGFCPLCAGEMAGELVRGVEADTDPPRPSMASFECTRCSKVVRMSGATVVTFHPVVEGFLFEHGFDTRTAPHSEVWEALDDTAERTHSTDPLTVEVTFTHDGEDVRAVVGENATIEAVNRH